MSLLEAILIGIIQGATEFLPISSDGHLVLVPAILGLPQPDLVLIGLVHAGTLLAIVLANWWRVATQMGLALGLLPWEALPKMGPGFAWTLVRLANGWTDLAFYAAAVALAAWLGNGRALSARRPAPSVR